MEPLLRIVQLTKVYGGKTRGAIARALAGLDLEVGTGEFVSVMGPSGSGKTTLLNCLAGLDRPTSGEIWLNGKNYHAISADAMAKFRRTHLGFVFQDFNLLDTLTVEENVLLPIALDRQGGPGGRERVREWLQRLGLEEYRQRFPYELSGGQQQRTAVARALIHRPDIVLADEPTGNLDSASARTLLETFSRVNRENGATLLMVTHDPYAASYSQRVVFIKDGAVFAMLDEPGSREQHFEAILNTLAVLEGHSA